MLWLPLAGLLSWGAGAAVGANVLAILPTASFSHQLFYRAYLRELHRRGHTLTVVTPDPLRDPTLRGYAEIDISYQYPRLKALLLSISDKEERKKLYLTEILMLVFGKIVTDFCRLHLSDPDLQRLYRGDQKFDLTVVEYGTFSCFLPFGKLSGGKTLGIASYELGSMTRLSLGSPFNPAHVPETNLPYSDRMTFPQRLRSVAFNSVAFLFYRWLRWEESKIARECLGEDVGSVHDLEANVSLVLHNAHFSISYPKPDGPNLISVGGPPFHLNGVRPKPLSKELKEFMDAATDGVIYFSLGTNVKTGNISGKEEILLQAFRGLKQRVVWKWENENLPLDLDNVMMAKWFPQVDVLAHPKTRAFVTQGGLQSLGEAIEHHVPMVVMPFFADQGHNARKMELTGCALQLDFDTVTAAALTEALREVVYNATYRENVEKLSRLVKDQPLPPLEKAVWWTEYVIRHDGAPHLRSAAATMPWYQYFLLDVLAALSLGTLLAGYVVYLLAKTLVRAACRRGSPKKN